MKGAFNMYLRSGLVKDGMSLPYHPVPAPVVISDVAVLAANVQIAERIVVGR